MGSRKLRAKRVQSVRREGEEVLGGGWRSRCEAFGCTDELEEW